MIQRIIFYKSISKIQSLHLNFNVVKNMPTLNIVVQVVMNTKLTWPRAKIIPASRELLFLTGSREGPANERRGENRNFCGHESASHYRA